MKKILGIQLEKHDYKLQLLTSRLKLQKIKMMTMAMLTTTTTTKKHAAIAVSYAAKINLGKNDK